MRSYADVAGLTAFTASGRGAVTLRRLRWRDAAFAWRVAAEPSVRAMSFDQRPPSIGRHLRWLWALILGTDEGWVVCLDGARVGIAALRFRMEGPGYFISVAVLPQARGYGVGTRAVRLVTARVAPCEVWADIKRNNIASLRLFHGAGYGHDVTTEEGHWRLRYPAR